MFKAIEWKAFLKASAQKNAGVLLRRLAKVLGGPPDVVRCSPIRGHRGSICLSICRLAICWVLTITCCSFQQGVPSAKDTPEKSWLRWDFHPGDTYELSWKGTVKSAARLDGMISDEVNYTMDTAALFTITEVGTDGSANGEFKHSRISKKGLIARNKEMEVEVENDEIRLPPPPRSERTVDLIKSWLVPVKVNMSPTGEIGVDLKHPLVAFLGGYGTSLGPVLPKKPVGIGDSWEVVFQGQTGKVPDDQKIPAKYVLASIAEEDGKKVAKITLATTHNYVAQGLDCSCEISVESSFLLPNAGHIRSLTTAVFNGSGKVGTSSQEVNGKATMAFEMKKR